MYLERQAFINETMFDLLFQLEMKLRSAVVGIQHKPDKMPLFVQACLSVDRIGYSVADGGGFEESPECMMHEVDYVVSTSFKVEQTTLIEIKIDSLLANYVLQIPVEIMYESAGFLSRTKEITSFEFGPKVYPLIEHKKTKEQIESSFNYDCKVGGCEEGVLISKSRIGAYWVRNYGPETETYNKGLGYIIECADSGDVGAARILAAQAVYKPETTKQAGYDQASGLSLIKDLVQKGDKDSAAIAGMIYTDGIVVEKNEERAVAWFELAVKQAYFGAEYINPVAATMLGVLYGRGFGSNAFSDNEKALNYFKHAADYCSIDAIMGLRQIYSARNQKDQAEKYVRWFAEASGYFDRNNK